MSELSVNLNALPRSATSADSSAALDEIGLMQRLHHGDEMAMTVLIQQHGNMLARLIGRLTAWHTDREDILQDVLLTVWQRAGSYRADGCLEGWLRRVAVNRCRNHFRASNAFNRLVERFALLLPTSMASQIDVGMDEFDRKCELEASLKKLPQIDRTTLVLYYLEEMPADEVAQILNMKLETLHVRLHRARKKLKQIFEDQDA